MRKEGILFCRSAKKICECRLSDRDRYARLSTIGAIETGKVIIETKNGIRKELATDSVIFSTGSVSADSFSETLKDHIKEVYMVGDAKEPGTLGLALRSAPAFALAL